LFDENQVFLNTTTTPPPPALLLIVYIGRNLRVDSITRSRIDFHAITEAPIDAEQQQHWYSSSTFQDFD
jgi:hypothetical protein